MATGDNKEKKAKAEPKAAAEKAAAPKKAPRAKAPKAEGTAQAAKADAKGLKASPASKKTAAAPKGEGGGQSARAQARYVRMAPRKLRLVMDAIRGKSVAEARGILRFCGKRAAGPLSKVLESAVANAENNAKPAMSTDNLVISTAFVDQGPSFKSFIPRARGRASSVHKFTSHITIEVKEREEA